MNKNLLSSPKRVVLLLSSILLLIYVLLFYKEDQLKELFKLTKPDRISVLYLNLLLNANPDNDGLRLELARHYINLREDNIARIELNKIVEKPNFNASFITGSSGLAIRESPPMYATG